MLFPLFLIFSCSYMMRPGYVARLLTLGNNNHLCTNYRHKFCPSGLLFTERTSGLIKERNNNKKQHHEQFSNSTCSSTTMRQGTPFKLTNTAGCAAVQAFFLQDCSHTFTIFTRWVLTFTLQAVSYLGFLQCSTHECWTGKDPSQSDVHSFIPG